jgi:N-acylneuraminate cytidylyltransferase/CMP-N,N'-diacetyllegionaminic acid synthase
MIAIIPARGGSKGIPRKNIRDLAGKPLIVWTIETVLGCKNIEEAIVSTDDAEIADVARAYGGHVPFMRPKELSEDGSPAIDAYLYTVDRLVHEGSKKLDAFAVFLPTSPLREVKDIESALAIFESRNADSVVSVVQNLHPPEWAKRIEASGVLHEYFPDFKSNLNRQDYPHSFVPNGSIYVFKTTFLRSKRTYYSKNTYAYVMPKERSIDIDDEYDLALAEWLMAKRT